MTQELEDARRAKLYKGLSGLKRRLVTEGILQPGLADVLYYLELGLGKIKILESEKNQGAHRYRGENPHVGFEYQYDQTGREVVSLELVESPVNWKVELLFGQLVYLSMQDQSMRLTARRQETARHIVGHVREAAKEKRVR